MLVIITLIPIFQIMKPALEDITKLSKVTQLVSGRTGSNGFQSPYYSLSSPLNSSPYHS